MRFTVLLATKSVSLFTFVLLFVRMSILTMIKIVRLLIVMFYYEQQLIYMTFMVLVTIVVAHVRPCRKQGILFIFNDF